MGAYLLLKFWLARWRYKFLAWRKRRREKHDNAIIAMQQSQLKSVVQNWEAESATHHRHVANLTTQWDAERRELQLQIELLSAQVAGLNAVVVRDRARVEAESAYAARFQQECLHAKGLVLNKA